MDFRHTQLNDYEDPPRRGYRLWRTFLKNLNDYNDYERPSCGKTTENGRVQADGGRKTTKNRGQIGLGFSFSGAWLPRLGGFPRTATGKMLLSVTFSAF